MDTTSPATEPSTRMALAFSLVLISPRVEYWLDLNDSGDQDGVLRMLVLIREGNQVKDIRLETLGHTSAPSTISYLDDGVVFIGSLFGDSQVSLSKTHFCPHAVRQLIKLNTAADSNGSFVEELTSFPNIGPILDFSLVEVDQGQTEV